MQDCMNEDNDIVCSIMEKASYLHTVEYWKQRVIVFEAGHAV